MKKAIPNFFHALQYFGIIWWVAEQAVSAGYQQWTIKNAVTNFQKDVLDREDKGKARFG